MTIERINTNRFKLIPEGIYKFEVLGVPRKFRTKSGKFTYRVWDFNVMVEGEVVKKSFIVMPWDSRELLLAVGGEDLGGGDISWDDETVPGKCFNAQIIHEKDDQGNIREKMTKVEQLSVAWDEAF